MIVGYRAATKLQHFRDTTGFICSSDAADEDRLAEEDVDRFVDRKMDEDTFSGPDALSGRTEILDAA